MSGRKNLITSCEEGKSITNRSQEVNINISIVELFKPIVKQVLESMLKEERKIYLEDNPNTKGNGYYERDMKTAF